MNIYLPGVLRSNSWIGEMRWYNRQQREQLGAEAGIVGERSSLPTDWYLANYFFDSHRAVLARIQDEEQSRLFSVLRLTQ